MIMDSPQMKTNTFMLEDFQVNPSPDHVEEAEEYYITRPLLHPRTTPKIGYHYLYLFSDILTQTL